MKITITKIKSDIIFHHQIKPFMYGFIKPIHGTNFFYIFFIQPCCTSIQTTGTAARLTYTMLTFQFTNQLLYRSTWNKLRYRKCNQHDTKQCRNHQQQSF